jgi:hypothetical protein
VKRIAFFAVVLPILVFSKESWQKGSIKVLDTDDWCSRPGIPDWPGVCGPPRSDSLSLFNDAGDASHPGIPHSQLLEIDAPDAIYVVKRTSFDGGLQFRPGAVAQFAGDGKHLIIKFDRETSNRRGDSRVQHEQDRTDILQIRKP